MSYNTAYGHSVGLLALFFACSIIIPVVEANQYPGGKVSGGGRYMSPTGSYPHYNLPSTPRYSLRNQQERIPANPPTESTATTTSTEPPVTRQPFHELAADLKDDYFSFEDSSEERSVSGPAVSNDNEDEHVPEILNKCPELTNPSMTAASQLQEEEEDVIQLKKALEKACSILRKYVINEAERQPMANDFNIDDACTLLYKSSDPRRPNLFYNYRSRRNEDYATFYRLEGRAEDQTEPAGVGNVIPMQFRNTQDNETIIASFRKQWSEFQARTACVLDKTKYTCTAVFRT